MPSFRLILGLLVVMLPLTWKLIVEKALRVVRALLPLKLKNWSVFVELLPASWTIEPPPSMVRPATVWVRAALRVVMLKCRIPPSRITRLAVASFWVG